MFKMAEIESDEKHLHRTNLLLCIKIRDTGAEAHIKLVQAFDDNVPSHGNYH